MTDRNDFLNAIDWLITEWRFQRIVDAEFARGTSTPGSVPRATTNENAPAMTGQGDLENHAR